MKVLIQNSFFCKMKHPGKRIDIEVLIQIENKNELLTHCLLLTFRAQLQVRLS